MSGVGGRKSPTEVGLVSSLLRWSAINVAVVRSETSSSLRSNRYWSGNSNFLQLGQSQSVVTINCIRSMQISLWMDDKDLDQFMVRTLLVSLFFHFLSVDSIDSTAQHSTASSFPCLLVPIGM